MDVAELAAKLDELTRRVEESEARSSAVSAERDEYKRLYKEMLEKCRRLELGLLGQKSERLPTDEAQLTLQVLGSMLEVEEGEAPTAKPEQVRQHERRKPTGRKPLPEDLPRVEIELVPDEVKRKGLDAFDVIGTEVRETVERRPSSMVVLRTIRPKFAPKDRHEAADAEIQIAAPLELPIPRGLAGPGLLADTIVRRWQDHMPLNRLSKMYRREGLDLARSTICDWHGRLGELVTPLVDAMRADARKSPYLCIDATGVLVQAKERCRHGHFWVLVAPGRHVLYSYTPKHDSAAVNVLLAGYGGYVVADAHSVYDHLYGEGGAIEVGCWAHARRYFFKALDSDYERSVQALSLIKDLFLLEREYRNLTPKKRKQARRAQSKLRVDAFFKWCDRHQPEVLPDTPIAKAIQYARNQREALHRFLEDGRLPLHNNISELHLRRQAIGRKNWLFVGNDDAGATNTAFVSLLASCEMHDIEPLAYMRDLLILLPGWSRSRVLELAPVNWTKTSGREDVVALLEANPLRRLTLE